MSDGLITAVVTILTAIVGVALIAVLVSKNANTTGVITAGSQGFAGALGAALAPVTGGGGSFNFSGGAQTPYSYGIN